MARAKGVYRRGDSPYWWIDVVLPDGRRLRQSAKTAKREEAEALLAKLRGEVFRAGHLGIKAERSWQEAVVRYLATKLHLRDIEKQRAICRQLDPYLGELKLAPDQRRRDLARERKRIEAWQQAGNGESPARFDPQRSAHGAGRLAVDRYDAEGAAASRRSGARPVADEGRGEAAGSRVCPASCGDGPFRARHRLSRTRGCRIGMVTRRFETSDGMDGPDQEWHAERRSAQSRCGCCVARTGRKAPALLLHVPRSARYATS